MVVTSAVSAMTTYLERGANTIAEVNSIVGPKMSLDTIDSSNLLSPNNFKEFIGGMLDGGEVTIEGSFYPGDTNGQIGLTVDMLARTVQDFTITFPTSTGTTWTFKGLVTAFETGAVKDDRLTFSATIKVTAKPTLGVTASADITDLIVREITGPAVVTGVPTPFAGATYVYSYVVNTASGTITLEVDHNTAAFIVAHNSFNDHETDLLDDTESGALPLGLADTITTFTVTVTVTNQAPKSYTLYIIRP